MSNSNFQPRPTTGNQKYKICRKLILININIFIYPFKEMEKIKNISGYVYRKHPIYNAKKLHYGIDFSDPKRTPILAVANGKVRKVYENPKTYGKFVIIEHTNGFSSLSEQLSEYNVKVGDEVKQGNVIGFVGNSGLSTGPHLHLELKKTGSMYIRKIILKKISVTISKNVVSKVNILFLKISD